MQYASYNALCATPATQSQFLETLATDLHGIEKDHERRAHLTKISVGGKPFSIGMYCAAVEMASQNWDCDEDDLELHRFVRAVKQLEAVYPDMKPSGFVFNFHQMPGSDAPAPVMPKRINDITTGIMGSPTLGKSILAGGSTGPARVNVTTDVHTDGARRVMRPH